jgi:1,4-alpha-glucan branching enzyme
MAIPVEFAYYPGLGRSIFSNVRLTGSWDAAGHYSDQWTILPLAPVTGEDGCPCFKATVSFADSQIGRQFRWGVLLNAAGDADLWGIVTELKDLAPQDRYRQKYRTMVLQPAGPNPQKENYYLTHCRRLGANKYYLQGALAPGIRFAVWAPNAENVEVVIGDQHTGYIADDGSGIIPQRGPLPMVRQTDGVWQTDITASPELRDFTPWDHIPYMFRVTKKGGRVAYRTDLYSRCQIGSGNWDPRGEPYTGDTRNLDGTVSCSVVVNPDTVCRRFQEPVWPETEFIPASEFWQEEFPPGVFLPQRVEDLVIYELHVGAIWNSKGRPGDLQDAMALLPYLRDLGVNAVELLPMNEFEGWAQWGYGSSHFFAVEYSSGGRDQFKHFVRECHRHGIAVILDVVYNHYHHHAERAQWAYDSDAPEGNIYYWYEGRPTDYSFIDGGYLDNMSTGYAPRFYEDNVRKMFISSAVALMEEFHVDGFRVDQTTSIHSYNVLHADGRRIDNANIFGGLFLREWTRTLKLINPQVILMAEDHSEWPLVTASPDEGGLGFDATWYANFYHHLIGDTGRGPDFAKLLLEAGRGQDQPLAMDYFAGTLAHSESKKVVYHESHDEAGNSQYSNRTIVTAVGSSPLVGLTRHFAEARCRFCVGMAMLSPGTPMFLFGEEIGAQKDYRYNTFLYNRENLRAERQGNGQRLFLFYQDLIKFRRHHSGLKSHNIEILHVHNANRVLAFRRWDDLEELLVVASLNNQPFAAGYVIANPSLKSGPWQEIFNSDAMAYGGNDEGNQGATVSAHQGLLEVVIPANGFVVFLKG